MSTGSELDHFSKSLQAAMLHLQTGAWQAAEQICLALCSKQPPPADAVHLLAVIYAQTQRPDLAEKAFQQAITLASNRADFYGNYANLLWETGRITDTIRTCQQAITLHSNRPEVFNTLGNALFRSGNFQDAAANYRLAIGLNPQYAEAHNNLGQALKAQKAYAAAEQCFRTALSIQPDFEQAEQNLQQVDPIWLAPLRGKKVTLRRFCTDDVDYLQQCYQNPEFMRRYHRLMPILSGEALVTKLKENEQQHPSQLNAISWVILSKGGLQLIGIANLVEIQLPHRRAELLIGLPNPADRNTGIGTEATLLVPDFAFNAIHLNKVISFVYNDNALSQKNTLALGFSQEGVLKQHLRDANTKRYIDLHSNAMTQGEFRDNARLAKLSKRLLGRDITAAGSQVTDG